MPGDPEVDDPLLRALAELRDEVHRLINEQLAYLKERTEEPAPPRTLRTTPVISLAERPEEPAKPRPLDARQRLDALAKHLDHRLRLANVPGTERSDRTPPPEE